MRSLQLLGPSIRSKAELQRVWAIVSIALAALGPTLTELRLSWEGPLPLEGWVEHMQQLQLAVVMAGRITGSPQLGALGRLRRLRLYASKQSIVGAPEGQHCLPPALEELSLCLPSLPRPLLDFGAIGGLGLISLELRGDIHDGLESLEGLGRLTTLRELRLSGKELGWLLDLLAETRARAGAAAAAQHYCGT